MIRLHTFQHHARYNEGRPRRFDVMILQHLAELLERDERDHEIVVVLPQLTTARGGAFGSGEILGERWGSTFDGLFNDALVIEDTDHDYFVVVDYQDCSEGPGYALSMIPQWRGSFLSMYHRPSVLAQYGPVKARRVWPGWFCDYAPGLTRRYREEVAEIRQDWDALDDRLFFMGTVGGSYRVNGHNIREAAEILREKYPDEVDIRWKRAGDDGLGEKLEREEWFLEAACHKVVLALPGHPWCYREHEMFSLGIPLLTYRWEAEIFSPWVPDVHYAATDPGERHPMGFPLNQELGALLLIERHRQILKEDPNEARHRAHLAQFKFDATNTPCSIALDLFHLCVCPR